MPAVRSARPAGAAAGPTGRAPSALWVAAGLLAGATGGVLAGLLRAPKPPEQADPAQGRR